MSSNVPTLQSVKDAPENVSVIGGGSIPIKSCPGGSGKKSGVYHYLSISKDKTRLICKKCVGKEWSLT